MHADGLETQTAHHHRPAGRCASGCCVVAHHKRSNGVDAQRMPADEAVHEHPLRRCRLLFLVAHLELGGLGLRHGARKSVHAAASPRRPRRSLASRLLRSSPLNELVWTGAKPWCGPGKYKGQSAFSVLFARERCRSWWARGAPLVPRAGGGPRCSGLGRRRANGTALRALKMAFLYL